jgi:hypothetical protein
MLSDWDTPVVRICSVRAQARLTIGQLEHGLGPHKAKMDTNDN